MRSSGLVMFACAGLLLSGGAILGGSVVWSLLRMSYYFWTTDLGVELSSSVLLLAGALLCLPSAWLCTLLPYHGKSLPINASIMAVLSVAMVVMSLGVSSIAGLSRVLREPSALNSSMIRALSMDAYDPAVRSSLSAMQIELKCCGVNSHMDWYQHRRSLPPSCCGRTWNSKHAITCDIPAYSVGCLRPALAELRNYCNSLASLSSSLVIIMAVALFTTAYAVVTSVLERLEVRVFKPLPPPLRVSCVAPPPFLPVTVPPPALHNYTSFK